MASAFFKPGGATAMAKAKAKVDAESALKKESDRENLKPWVEKYRPKTIRDVSSQDHAIQVLQATLSNSNLPHMLFYGPPGTGKTSTILALARELFGPELIKSRVLELNASDERGITIVREKIKTFAKSVVTQAVPGYPCPPFKIIILDEADSMTQDAQNALRRTMEIYSKITRFCLICNYVTRIIEPLTSRCSKFRFKPLSTDSTRSRIEYIAEKEGVQCQDGVVDTIIKTSDGDMRRAITYMQSASRLHKSEAVISTSIQEIAGVVPDPVIDQLVEVCGEKGFAGVQKAVQSIAYEGYSATQVILQLHESWIMSPTVAPLHKAKIAILMGETDKCLSDGADEFLQVLNLCLNVQKVLQG